MHNRKRAKQPQPQPQPQRLQRQRPQEHGGNRPQKRWAVVPLVVAAVAFLLAGCSSSNASSSSTSSGAGASGSGGTSGSAGGGGSSGGSGGASELKVGYICDCTGVFSADNIDNEDVMKAWVNTVNASGGVGGHHVQLIVKDDAMNPGTAISEVNTLISDHVDVIVDESTLDAVWASAVKSANIPVVGGLFTSEPFYTNSDFYASGQTNDSIVYSEVAVAKEAGAKSLGFFYCAEAVQCQQTVSVLKSTAQKQGVPEVYNASVSATAPNYTAQCLAAKQAHVSALFVADTSTVLQRIGENCSQQGYNPIYLTEGTGYSGLYLTTPGVKENTWTPYPVLPIFAKGPVQAMNAALQKYYPGLQNNPNDYTESVAQTWGAGLLIAEAVKDSGLGAGAAPTAAAIAKGLNAIHGDDLGGFSPTLTFTAGQPHPVDCWYTGRVVNGVPTLANGGKLSCEKSS